MANKVYFITFDGTDPSVDHARLKSFLKAGSPDVENWWNHIPNVFLISTSLDADAISDLIRPFTGRARFLVMEAHPGDSEGSLPEPAWRWIRTRSGEDEMSRAS
jgi:hypothetical protein